MSSININVGTTADDGQGDSLRTAFISVRRMLSELYGITYTSDTQDISGTTFRVPLATISDQAANTVMVRDANSSGTLSAKAVTNQQILIGDGTGFTAAALSGDVTMSNSGAVTIESGAIDTAMIADDQVTPAKINILDDSLAATDAHIIVGDGSDFSNVAVSGDIAITNTGAVTIQADSVEHSMIENRYTAVGTIANTLGATSVDWSAAAVYKMNSALTGGIEFDFTGYKAGQVLTIYNISGTETITLDSDASTSEAFLKVGGVDYDGSATSILQVECLADGADAVFAYSVAQYASDPTP